MAEYEENLKAVISGETQDLQKSLKGVKSNLDEVADKAAGASREVGKLSSVFEGAEESAEGYEDTIGDIAEHLSVAAKAFDKFGDEARETVPDTTAAATAASKTSRAIDEVGDEAVESTAEINAYNAAVSSVFGGGALSSGSVSSVLPGGSGTGEAGDASSDVASGRTSMTRAREAVQDPLGALMTDGGREPIDFSELESLETQLSGMPNIKFGRGHSADELADKLAVGSHFSENIADNLGGIEGIDDIISGTSDIDTLSEDLSEIGEGQRASQVTTASQERISTSIIESALQSSSSLNEFQTSVRKTRRSTDALISEMNDLPPELSEVNDEAAKSSRSINEYGDGVRKATKRTDEFDGKLRGI
jgi:methyl-accepting chemotaxis protein